MYFELSDVLSIPANLVLDAFTAYKVVRVFVFHLVIILQLFYSTLIHSLKIESVI